MSAPIVEPPVDINLGSFVTHVISDLADCSPAQMAIIEQAMVAACWTLNLSVRPAGAFCQWQTEAGPRRVDFLHPKAPPLETGRPDGVIRITTIPFRSIVAAARLLAQSRAARAAPPPVSLSRNSAADDAPPESENAAPSARTKAANSSSQNSNLTYTLTAENGLSTLSTNRKYPILRAPRKGKRLGSAARSNAKDPDRDNARRISS